MSKQNEAKNAVTNALSALMKPKETEVLPREFWILPHDSIQFKWDVRPSDEMMAKGVIHVREVNSTPEVVSPREFSPNCYCYTDPMLGEMQCHLCDERDAAIIQLRESGTQLKEPSSEKRAIGVSPALGAPYGDLSSEAALAQMARDEQKLRERWGDAGFEERKAALEAHIVNRAKAATAVFQGFENWLATVWIEDLSPYEIAEVWFNRGVETGRGMK